jgi:hypothetical protein
MRIVIAMLLVACGNHPNGTDPDGGTEADGATADASNADAPPKPSAYPRLLVSGSHGVAIWDNVDKLTADGPPNAMLAGIDRGELGMGVHDDTLFVTSNGPVTALYPLYRFANADRDRSMSSARDPDESSSRRCNPRSRVRSRRCVAGEDPRGCAR